MRRAFGTSFRVDLTEQFKNGDLQCRLCQRCCVLAPDEIGYCFTKINVGGTLYSTTYGVVSTIGIDPIEKKPVFHYRPGTKVLTLGGLGCNFRCDFCQNWEISFANGMNAGGLDEPNLLPQDAVALAVTKKCQGIGWSYNEPSIWLDYVLDCAVLAKEHGLFTVYVTNGYITPQALDLLGPYIDVYKVDLKSLSPEFYSKLAHGADVFSILETTVRAKSHWQMHVETATTVIPSWNDDDASLRQIAAWIVNNLGDQTPWHLNKFVPYAKMADLPPTSIGTLRRAIQIGKSQGLKFIYSDDLEIQDAQSTICPDCGHLLVARRGYLVSVAPGMESGKCPSCGSAITITIRT